MHGQPNIDEARYCNPVYPHSFPDPFVLKFRGQYYAYCTGFDSDGRVFSILGSGDLVHWVPLGGAMRPLKTEEPFYWAPEVTYYEGRFYLYYSVGNETLMELRVAVSDRPDGGFVDAGVGLTNEEFAIDAHVFTDDDGRRYMFYATDFLSHSHIGTGTVVDRLIDPYNLAGKARPVTRAKYDWQVYDPQRKEKGGVRWHTVEGPTVFKRKGIYFEMFSGGNWQNTTYGVSFAVTESLTSKEEWRQYSDGNTILPILRSVPGEVIGPGHNSIIRGPNNREIYCVYHRWTDDGRVVAIDRMDVAGERIFIVGATNTPQPAPFAPTASGFGADWTATGEWALDNVSARSSDAECSLTRHVPTSFICEFAIRCDAGDADEAFINIDFSGMVLSFGASMEPGETEISAECDHLVSVEVDTHWVSVLVDDRRVVYQGWTEEVTRELTISTEGVRAEFNAFSLTEGFEDLFNRGIYNPSMNDWLQKGVGILTVDNGELTIESRGDESTIFRDQVFPDIDLAANIRCSEMHDGIGSLGLVLLDPSGMAALRLTIAAEATLETDGSTRAVHLPPGWDIGELRQYRLLTQDGKLRIYLEDHLLIEETFTAHGFKPGLFCDNCTMAVEMARATSV